MIAEPVAGVDRPHTEPELKLQADRDLQRGFRIWPTTPAEWQAANERARASPFWLTDHSAGYLNCTVCGVHTTFRDPDGIAVHPYCSANEKTVRARLKELRLR